MPDPANTNPTLTPEVQVTLHEVAQLLREGRHLGPEAQQALAELMDELSKALDPAADPSDELAHLASSTGLFLRALREPHDQNLLDAARTRLEEAAVRAEGQAPVATGVVRRVLDALANWGI